MSPVSQNESTDPERERCEWLYREWIERLWNGESEVAGRIVSVEVGPLVDGDRFVEYWVSSDGVSLMRQLGML